MKRRLEPMLRVATSTVAMTAYNALVLIANGPNAGPATREELSRFAWQTLGFRVDDEQLAEALDELVARKRIAVDAGRYIARGPRGALCRARNRVAGGGWESWLVDVPNRGRVLLDEVIS